MIRLLESKFNEIKVITDDHAITIFQVNADNTFKHFDGIIPKLMKIMRKN